MRGYSSSDDHEPLFWLRGRPIDVTSLLILVFTASMLITTLLMALNLAGVLGVLAFSSGAVLHGALWQLFTYAFVNPPSIRFLIDMVMLWWFGREVERYFGRRAYLRFYGFVIVASALLLTLIGLKYPMRMAGQPGSLAVFIAFATLYPNVPLIFGILAKWFAVGLVAIYTLTDLADHNWIDLLTIWTTVAIGYGFVRYEQGRFSLPALRLPGFLNWRRPKFHVVPKPDPEPERRDARAAGGSETEVDALLDKIAKSGLQSLTPEERARLEKARQDLLKKGH